MQRLTQSEGNANFLLGRNRYELTQAELTNDILMNETSGHMIGDHYTSRRMLHAQRLQRIDTIFQALKDQGLIPYCTEIDTPLQRLALWAFLKPLYSLHYPTVSGMRAGRHGRSGIDIYFAGLTEMMRRYGFKPEVSHEYLTNSERAEDCKKFGEEFASELWGKYSQGPSNELLAQQQEDRHRYSGNARNSLLAEAQRNAGVALDGYED